MRRVLRGWKGIQEGRQVRDENLSLAVLPVPVSMPHTPEIPVKLGRGERRKNEDEG